MELKTLITDLPISILQGPIDLQIEDVQADSRLVSAGQLFVAIKGTQVDGHTFIDKAIAQGAKAILVSDVPAVFKPGICYLATADTSAVLGHLYANLMGRPADRLHIVGITGTNGKTTTATLLHQLFQELGYKVGLISTIKYQIGEEVQEATHTTPGPKRLQKMFREMVDAGISHCFMEVSSHALVQRRVAAIPFKVAAFTNITHDHLDYHGTFKAYIVAKKMLFDGLSQDAVAITNVDDRNGNLMLQNTAAKRVSYGLKRMADYKGKLLENTFDGLRLAIDDREVWFRLRGSFNAYNLLMVYGVARELGMDAEEVLQAMSALEGAEGRFQVIRAAKDQKTAIVDYAHTPDALENVLQTLQDILQPGQHLITVVGCGGNRDREKRPKMAKIATERSAKVILTSDNPRDEDPEAILDEMMAGVETRYQSQVLRIIRREDAIKTAIQLAKAGDVMLVAGKGHETYQEIKGVKYPFDDREILRKYLGLA